MCPSDFVLETDGKHCVWSCDSGKRAFNKAAGEYVCVDDCPDYAPVFGEAQTCITCATKNVI